MLEQRTNKFEVWAEDAAGNRSATNPVDFVYAKSGLLLVAAVGQGTISPNYSNAVLEIGLSQSVKAAGVNGHQFRRWEMATNWLDPVVVTNATLNFVMQSNLTLTVVFADTNRPVVTVTNLVANQRISNAVFTVRGKVTDNAGVSNVWYRLNGAPDWLPASGVVAGRTSLWSAPLMLEQRTNKFEVWAEDAAGNRSATNPVSFVYVKSGLLLVAAVINGRLQMRLSGLPGAVVVESSADLMHWVPIQTNIVPPDGISLSVPMTNHPAQFFRVRLP
jgi:hypothetical protein